MAGSNDSNLSSLALKLSPGLGLLLQAWLAPASAANAAPRLVSAWSKHSARPNSWYHIAIVSGGGVLRLHVNGRLEANASFDGWLATPPRPSDGDVISDRPNKRLATAATG